MTIPAHDSLAYRLAGLLLKLNQGDTLDIDELAAEYGVSGRTIYRDINRLGRIIDQDTDGHYRLAAVCRGELSPRDLENFARLAGVEDLFLRSGQRFLVTLLDTLSQGSFCVHGHHYEALKPHDETFQLLEQAIREHQRCALTYADKRRELEPYRLINSKGIWYLAATEAGSLKSFALSRIGQLHVGDDGFAPSADIQSQSQIEADDDAWFSQGKTEVLLSVAPQVAYYFKRRKLLPLLAIDKELENGGFIVSSRISDKNQMLPLVRYWIQHLQILEPKWLRDQPKRGPQEFLA